MLTSMGVIFVVAGGLIFAAVLIFWKSGENTKYRFVRLSLGNLLIHLMDGLITYVNTPDLAREGNPLVRRLGYGWGALFTANLIGFVMVVLCTWYFGRYEHVVMEADNMFDYFMKLFHGEDYKPIWFWYKWSRNYRSMLAMCGYGIYWGVTAGAPVFVIGWMLDMLNMYPVWWKSTWIAMGISIFAAFFSIYIWVRNEYNFSKKHT